MAGRDGAPVIAAMLVWQALAAPPPVQRFGDWVLACDNRRTCHAMPAAGNARTMPVVRRDGAPAAAAVLEVPIAADVAAGTKLALAVDGRVLAQIVAPGGGRGMALPFTGRIAAALLRGRRMVLGEAHVPLTGLGAALAALDEAQLRTGTRTALRRPGRNAGRTIPAPPPLPVIEQPEVTGAPPRKYSAKDATKLIGRHKAKCGRATPQVVRLDAASHLLTIPDPCVTAPTALFILPEKGKPAAATFDTASVPANLRWDQARRRLTTQDDCGGVRDFAWDGARFRLAKESVPITCGAADGHVTTWRTQVVVR